MALLDAVDARAQIPLLDGQPLEARLVEPSTWLVRNPPRLPVAASREATMCRLAAILLTPLALVSPVLAAEEAVSRVPAWVFAFEGLDGGRIDLKSFTGRPVLVVNTASRCGFTPQYADLQEIWDRYRDRGLVVLGVPSNDFGGQEPGTASEIRGVCSGTFGVSFPMAAKQTVAGPGAHPFYRWAARERPGEVPRWNFHKYLVGRDGRLAAVFESRTRPVDPRVVAAIEATLAPRAE